MIQAYQAALSGVKANATRIQANSNNIANANTNGFRRDRVTLSNTDPYGVKANVEKDTRPGSRVFEQRNGETIETELSNVDLGKELPELTLNKRFYEANLKTIDTVTEMTGSLLELKS